MDIVIKKTLLFSKGIPIIHFCDIFFSQVLMQVYNEEIQHHSLSVLTVYVTVLDVWTSYLGLCQCKSSENHNTTKQKTSFPLWLSKFVVQPVQGHLNCNASCLSEVNNIKASD